MSSPLDGFPATNNPQIRQPKTTWEQAGYDAWVHREDGSEPIIPYNLASCFECTGEPPFAPSEVVKVETYQEGERDGDNWVWGIWTDRDKRWGRADWVVIGGCDYTGWDCQASHTLYKATQ